MADKKITKVAVLTFKSDISKNGKATVRIPDVRNDLQAQEVKEVMSEIVAKNFFGGNIEPTGLVGAKVVQTDTQVLEITAE
ncbi:DUF2922 domain-containing protein [Ligilactobacillus salivarius]|uniref:DUF2922 domain-containing protein n=1 Tax=Ligilactobacillus salivarius TaxID=1624 RepID=UPI003F23AD93